MNGAAEQTQRRGFWSTLSRRKGVVVLVAAPILLLLWFLFRPEKLFINERVNEPAPFSTPAAERVEYLGKMESLEPSLAGKRASILRRANGERVVRIPAASMEGGPYKVALSSADAQSFKLGSRMADTAVLVEVTPPSSNSTAASTQDWVIPAAAESTNFTTLIVLRASDREILARTALEPF
jgi:hypothetical protein